jgi:DNA-binding beta-propeller fold protein YncE
MDAFVPSGSGGLTGDLDPQFFTWGPDGNLYVTSPGTNSVLRYDGASGAFIDAFIPPGSGGLNGPNGIQFRPDGRVYVGSAYSNEVFRYEATSGALVDVFVSAGSGGLNLPVEIRFGPDGNLYVVSLFTSSIMRYDGMTGAFIDVFASEGLTLPRTLLFKEKITMCHRPPGNPGRAQTITVAHQSGADHVAHGDAVGACP